MIKGLGRAKSYVQQKKGLAISALLSEIERGI